MGRSPAQVRLSESEEATLREWIRKGTSESRLVDRARIILLSNEGLTVAGIAEQLRTRPARVSKWRQRFAADRLAALSDAPRSGKPHKYDDDVERRVLGLLDTPPPKGYAQWNGALLARALGDVSDDHVWRILRKRGIQLQRHRSWRITTEPEFAPKATDVVGLYLDPPENAAVICVDEKPHIPPLQRAQGYLRLLDGKALNGFRRGSRRLGATTLLAALDVAAGQAQAGHYSRRRRREFLDFLNEVVAETRGRETHVLLDSPNTPQPRRDRWLQGHPNVHLHFIPTYGGWLDQVECWFSILSRTALRGGSVDSARQLRQAIDAFVASHHPQAAPFEWTKAVVRPTAPRRSYADLCK